MALWAAGDSRWGGVSRQPRQGCWTSAESSASSIPISSSIWKLEKSMYNTQLHLPLSQDCDFMGSDKFSETRQILVSKVLVHSGSAKSSQRDSEKKYCGKAAKSLSFGGTKWHKYEWGFFCWASYGKSQFLFLIPEIKDEKRPTRWNGAVADRGLGTLVLHDPAHPQLLRVGFSSLCHFPVKANLWVSLSYFKKIKLCP